MKMNKFILTLFSLIIFLSLNNLASANIAGNCSGTAYTGQVVNSNKECLSCMAHIVPVYEFTIFGEWNGFFKTIRIGCDSPDGTCHQMVCADSLFVWWDKITKSEEEFAEEYPTGTNIEQVNADLAKERVPLKMEQVIYQEKKKNLQEAMLTAWGLNVALIFIPIEMLRITLYLFELWFLIVIVLVIIPNLFFKLRDAIVRSFMNKRSL